MSHSHWYFDGESD